MSTHLPAQVVAVALSVPDALWMVGVVVPYSAPRDMRSYYPSYADRYRARVAAPSSPDGLEQQPYQQRRDSGSAGSRSRDGDRKKDNLRQMSTQIQTAKRRSDDERIRTLEGAVEQLRKQNEELRSMHPVEAPLNRLKRRNQELASVAKQLEDRARTLEHSQRYPRADGAAKNIINLDTVRREFELKRAHDIAEHSRAMQERDRELEKLRASHDALRTNSERFTGERDQLETMLRTSQRERMLLEKQLSWNKDLLQEPVSRRERLHILTEKLKESDEERDRLQRELSDLQKKARKLQYNDSTVLTGRKSVDEGGRDVQDGEVAGLQGTRAPGSADEKISQVSANSSDPVIDPLIANESECDALRQKLKKMEDLLKIPI